MKRQKRYNHQGFTLVELIIADDKHIAGIHRGDLVKCGDSYYVYNAGDGGTPEGTWAPNPSGGSNVWYKIPQ